MDGLGSPLVHKAQRTPDIPKTFLITKHLLRFGGSTGSMSNGTMLNVTDSMQDAIATPIPLRVKFWTILIVQVPSLACTLFLLYHLLRDRTLRQAMNNHVIIILLILTLSIELFDNPLYIDAYRMDGKGYSLTMSPSICLMWWSFDYGAYGAITVFLAWGSVERHILVFHHRQLLRTARQRFFVHYLPLIVLTVYLTGFYVGVIIFPPCENTFDLQSVACGMPPCYIGVSSLNLWDYLINGILCTFVETTFSIGLLVRVLYQKRRVHQRLNWGKHRKMAFQLLAVSFLSLPTIFPIMLLTLIRQIGGTALADFGTMLDPYLTYLYTFVVLMLPLICLGYLPELWPRLFFLFRENRPQR